MYQGGVTRLTEATIPAADKIYAKADIVHVTGNTQINTIYPGLGSSQSQFLVLVADTASVILGTTGNILVGATASQNRAMFLVFCKGTGKWTIGL